MYTSSLTCSELINPIGHFCVSSPSVAVIPPAETESNVGQEEPDAVSASVLYLKTQPHSVSLYAELSTLLRADYTGYPSPIAREALCPPVTYRALQV